MQLLTRIAAQYFQTADHIIVLGNHGIRDQGTGQEIKTKASSIAKFSSELQSRSELVLSSNFDQLNVQVQAKEQAEVDLSRQTGDFSLYGKIAPHAITKY